MIKHHYKFNQKKVIRLTDEEHILIHNLENTVFTPFFRYEMSNLKKKIKDYKRKFHFIKAFRLKKIYRLFLNAKYDFFYQLLKRRNIFINIGLDNISLTSLKIWSHCEYRKLKKRHQYIRAYKLKRLIKKIDKM